MAKSKFGQVSQSYEAAMFYVMNMFDEMTGGAFKRGWRDMDKAEMLNEWDGLGPDQVAQLKSTKGAEWVASYGAQMERFRREMDGVRANAGKV